MYDSKQPTGLYTYYTVFYILQKDALRVKFFSTSKLKKYKLSEPSDLVEKKAYRIIIETVFKSRMKLKNNEFDTFEIKEYLRLIKAGV